MVFVDKMHDLISILENDGVIVYPTDTIWGLGCSVLSKKGLEKIYSIKGRKPEKPFVILCSSIEMLKKYVKSIHPRIETLLSFHERPLTIVYPEAKNLPIYAIGQDGSVAIRVTCDSFSQTIIDLLGVPIVSTSANISDQPFPQSFEDIDRKILLEADYVCLHNRSKVEPGKPSIIASYDKKGELIFLRS